MCVCVFLDAKRHGVNGRHCRSEDGLRFADRLCDFFFCGRSPQKPPPTERSWGGGRKGEEGSARGRRDRAQANRVYGKPNPENGFGPALDSGADASAGATDRPG